jgi:hypothetical protein
MESRDTVRSHLAGGLAAEKADHEHRRLRAGRKRHAAAAPPMSVVNARRFIGFVLRPSTTS